MLHDKANDIFKVNMPGFNTYNDINIDNRDIYSNDSTKSNTDNTFKAEKYKINNKEITEEYTTEHYLNAVNNEINLHKGSFAHNLHPNIEVLANSLLDKIDTLQRTQLDIHHVEMITERAFHNVEKLKYEIRAIHDYIENIESRNKNLESKLDLLITQNEAIIKQNLQLQNICQDFFSLKDKSNSDLSFKENDVKFNLEQENQYEAEYIPHNQKSDVSIYKSKNTINSLNVPENKTNLTNNEKLQRNNLNVNKINNEKEIKHLLKSKKQIETFIKKNYPEDYLQIKQYNKVNLFNWVNRVLGSN